MRIGLVLLLGVLGGCNYQERKGSAVDVVAGEQVIKDFASFERIIAKPYCLRCHTGEDSVGGPLDKGYQGLVDGGYLVPGDASNSTYFTVIEENYMPKRPPRPTAEELQLLKEWITNGAKEK
jgi:hypothetical protein